MPDTKDLYWQDEKDPVQRELRYLFPALMQIRLPKFAAFSGIERSASSPVTLLRILE